MVQRKSLDQYLISGKVSTRGDRGSDYSPATALSEEKDKLVTENWKDREKKYPRIIPKLYAHLHSMQKTYAKFQNN